jgi:hypothetical protein
LDRYYDPPCSKQNRRSERLLVLTNVLMKLFYEIAVDFINVFDKLSAASTEKPLKHTAKS